MCAYSLRSLQNIIPLKCGQDFTRTMKALRFYIISLIPSPSTMSPLLCLSGVAISPPSVAFLLCCISKTTFICCSLHRLLIGGDESMTESFTSIIRCAEGSLGGGTHSVFVNSIGSLKDLAVLYCMILYVLMPAFKVPF